MKSIYRRHIHYTKPISDSVYKKHKDKFALAFGENVPTYAQVFEWINDACGCAVIIYVKSHIEWNNSTRLTVPRKTSLPVFKAQAFHYSELSEAPEEFVDDWDGCADYAIDTFLSKVRSDENGPWYDEFTEEYDGSCDGYQYIEDYIRAKEEKQ